MNPWKGVGPGNARTDVNVSDATPSSSLLQSLTTGVLTYEPYYGLKAKPSSLTRDSRMQLWRAVIKSLLLPALGMGVMLFAGGIAVTSAGKGTLRAERPSLPLSPLLSAPSDSRPAALTPTQREIPVDPVELASTLGEPSPEQTWIVQVAAFASQARSTATVKQLTDQGLPAYEVAPEDTTSGLTVVRVGPFRTAREAGDVLHTLREMPDYEGAFVRNITSK